METKAVSRYVRIAPRKARIVVDLVRGKSVPQARARGFVPSEPFPS